MAIPPLSLGWQEDLGKVVLYSPCLFRLVVNGLSKIIRETKLLRELKGTQVTNTESLTQLIFMDDIFLLGKGNKAEI